MSYHRELSNFIKDGNLKKLLEYINEVKDPNAKIDFYGDSTLLMAACDLDKPDIVQTLIMRGADVEAKDREGNTALHRGIKSFDCVKILLENKANPNQPNNLGTTPLIYASTNSTPKINKLLLEAKADLNLKNKSGSSAIDCAKTTQRTEILALYTSYKPADYEPKGQSRPPGFRPG